MLPRFRRGAFALFALGFCVTMLLGDRSGIPLSLRPSELLAGHQWWTPITALVRAPEGLGMLALLWTLLVQWVVGSRLEGFWGTARYLIMVLVAGLVGHAAAIGLALLMPETSSLIYSGTGPLDAAAVVAFAWVFANEQLELGSGLGSAALPTVRVAAVLAPLVIGFPMLVTVVAGTAVASAWPTLLPGIVAAAVATVFVQPWRRREKSGKVAAENRRGQPHLRVVRTVDDLLN